MKDDILSIVVKFLDVAPENLQDHKTFHDLGIDSIDFVEIVVEIEEKFGVPVLQEMQERRLQLENLGQVVALAEELIMRHRAEEAVKPAEVATSVEAPPSDR